MAAVSDVPPSPIIKQVRCVCFFGVGFVPLCDECRQSRKIRPGSDRRRIISDHIKRTGVIAEPVSMPADAQSSARSSLMVTQTRRLSSAVWFTASASRITCVKSRIGPWFASRSSRSIGIRVSTKKYGFSWSGLPALVGVFFHFVYPPFHDRSCFWGLGHLLPRPQYFRQPRHQGVLNSYRKCPYARSG